MRSAAVAIASAIVCFGATSRAEPMRRFAVSDQGPLRSISIEVPEDDGQVCVVRPSTRGNCEKLNMERVEASAKSVDAAGSRVIGFAIAQHDECAFVVTVASIKQPSVDMTSEGIDQFVKGMKDGMAAFPGVQLLTGPARAKIRSWEGIEATFDSAGSEGATHSKMVALFSRNDLYQITVASSCERDQVHRVTDHIVGTLDFNPGDLGSFGKSGAFVQGKRTGFTLARIAPWAALISIVTWLVIRHRQNKSKT